jgi:hypothetical protein
MKTPISTALALLSALGLAACGSNQSSPDGGNTGPPLRFDAGTPRPDAGGGALDGGAADRVAACSAYCQKLFACGYFPLPGHPPGYNASTCTEQCSALGGFPPEERRQCVANASCTCDGGGCHTVETCFSSLVDGG